jgi:ribosomal protein S15P/S13E
MARIEAIRIHVNQKSDGTRTGVLQLTHSNAVRLADYLKKRSQKPCHGFSIIVHRDHEIDVRQIRGKVA